MLEAIVFIFIYIGVMAITAILFVVVLLVWIAGQAMRVVVCPVARVVGSLFAPAKGKPMPAVEGLSFLRCGNPHCQAANPTLARFCRRCGQSMQLSQVRKRRVACW